MKTTDVPHNNAKNFSGLTTIPKPLTDLFDRPINNIRNSKVIMTLSEFIEDSKHLYTHGKGKRKRKKHKGKKK